MYNSACYKVFNLKNHSTPEGKDAGHRKNKKTKQNKNKDRKVYSAMDFFLPWLAVFIGWGFLTNEKELRTHLCQCWEFPGPQWVWHCLRGHCSIQQGSPVAPKSALQWVLKDTVVTVTGTVLQEAWELETAAHAPANEAQSLVFSGSPKTWRNGSTWLKSAPWSTFKTT